MKLSLPLNSLELNEALPATQLLELNEAFPATQLTGEYHDKLLAAGA